MAIKVNEHLIPDWAIERQAEALFENVAKGISQDRRAEFPFVLFALAFFDKFLDLLQVRLPGGDPVLPD